MGTPSPPGQFPPPADNRAHLRPVRLPPICASATFTSRRPSSAVPWLHGPTIGRRRRRPRRHREHLTRVRRSLPLKIGDQDRTTGHRSLHGSRSGPSGARSPTGSSAPGASPGIGTRRPSPGSNSAAP